MSRAPAGMPSGCTLAAPDFRLREAEFRSLFARSLRAAQETSPTSARLLLDPACEGELRDLLARERRCCSFFDFDLRRSDGSPAVTVGVPTGREDALAFLLGLASR